ncbi:MAG: HoxN/HupN/NixA family nickel/cobalt transporter [Leifsonia sp.]
MFVATLHIMGWGILESGVLLAPPVHSASAVFSFGVGGTAYALGLRHAFDADHIAAIDNTTRRLLSNGRPANSVGLWFSLGHSTIVAVLSLVLTFGARAIEDTLSNETSTLRHWADAIGPTVSGTFLLAIAGMNAANIARRKGRDIHSGARAGGPISVLLRRMGAVVDRPSRMYAVGVLFGLGFDTASEIGLLALAGAASVGSAPLWSAMALPLIFAAGMSLLDSAQGAMSRRAYSWQVVGSHAAARRYDVLVTGASVMAAVTIGLAEFATVAASWVPGLRGWLAPIEAVPVDTFGFVLTGALLTTWAVAAFAVRPVLRPTRRIAGEPSRRRLGARE